MKCYYINKGRCLEISFSSFATNVMCAAVPFGVLMGNNKADHFIDCVGDLVYDLTGDMLVGVPCHMINHVFNLHLSLGFCTEPLSAYFMHFVK